MNTWEDLGPSPDTSQRIENAVVLMHEAKTGREPQPKRVDFFVRRLRPIACKELFDVLEQAADKCECPSPAEIRETVALRKRLNAPIPEQPILGDGERLKSRQAALLTALWLHYEKGWSFRDFGGTMMGAALKRQADMTDAEMIAALEAAKRKHPRDEIAKWMEGQP